MILLTNYVTGEHIMLMLCRLMQVAVMSVIMLTNYYANVMLMLCHLMQVVVMQLRV